LLLAGTVGVSLAFATPCLGGDDSKIEILSDHAGKVLVDQNVLRLLADLDRGIAPLGVRIFNYDKIETASASGLILVLAVRLPREPVDTKIILTVEHGFRAALDPRSVIIEMFTLEGGKIELPR
jgi:hypothetical protein